MCFSHNATKKPPNLHQEAQTKLINEKAIFCLYQTFCLYNHRLLA
jgi:hypothetical protein